MRVSNWGDSYGNRVDRFLACIAYLDGSRPSLVMCRGYYTRSVLVAWDWRDGQLTQRWTFDSNDSGNSAYAGQGNHNLSVADVDGDGKDEIIYGSCAIDDNGKGLYNTALGHGDAMHVSQMNPALSDQLVWVCHESMGASGNRGHTLRNARTGAILFSASSSDDAGRAMASDIDPRYPGYEVWGARSNPDNVTTLQQTSSGKPPMNFACWWDGDLLRELLDGTTISKWNWNTNKADTLLTSSDIASNNSTKATPNLSGDILGDWREEVVWRETDSAALRIYTTTIPTTYRLRTLMHDRQYRLAIAWQNVAYNQPPHPGFFLGDSMPDAPVPNIVTTLADLNAAFAKPAITSATTAAARAGADFFYAITVSNNATTYSATNLPAGLTLNTATGVITGKPAAVGTHTITLTATNANGSTTKTLTLTIAVAAPPPHTALVTLAGLALNQGAASGATDTARFNNPHALVAHTNGTLYIADTTNNAIRAIDASGNVTTLALTGGTLLRPEAIISGSGNTLIIADTGNNTIRSLNLATLQLTTLATQVTQPGGLARDNAGNLYIASTTRHAILKLASGATAPVTFSGTLDVSGTADGDAATARFNTPTGLAFGAGSDQTLYVADTTNNTIRKIDLATNTVSTLAGQPAVTGTASGPALQARFTHPEGIALDAAGTLYIADTGNHAIRRLDTITGEVTTISGLAASSGAADGLGANARLNTPAGLAIDSVTGDIYVADTANQTIRILLDGPRILKHPANQSITTGATAMFSVLALGAPNPNYQWRKNGATIAGATTYSYAISNAQTTHAGNYTVLVSNEMGSTTSQVATLTVTATSTGTTTPPPPDVGGGGGGGGGGAPSLLYFAAVIAIVAFSRVRRF